MVLKAQQRMACGWKGGWEFAMGKTDWTLATLGKLLGMSGSDSVASPAGRSSCVYVKQSGVSC